MQQQASWAKLPEVCMAEHMHKVPTQSQLTVQLNSIE